MAVVRILSFDTIGSNGMHDATSWQVAKDPMFKYLIDESLNDKINLLEWHTPLPKRPEDKEDPNTEEYYTDEVAIYARVRIHVGKTQTGWYTLPSKTQRYQEYTVTEDNLEDRRSNSLELGMVTTKDLLPPTWDYSEEDTNNEEDILDIKYCANCRRPSLMEEAVCTFCGDRDFTATLKDTELLPRVEEEKDIIPNTRPEEEKEPEDERELDLDGLLGN